MITPVIGIVVGLICGFGLAHSWPGHPVWASFAGLAGVIGGMAPLNLLMRKKVQGVFNAVQKHVETTQEELRRKINMMQQKNVSGGKGLQKRMEKDQANSIRGALEILANVKPYYLWAPLAERQANTLRAQLCFQIKEFEEADTCFKKCLIMEPVTLAMKMTRMYKRGEMDKLEKAFKKGVKRFKDDKGVLLYALYSWILVKEDRVDEAVALLSEGKEKTEDETIGLNWDHLANGRQRRFSNAGLGDQWYALHLEIPKPVKVRQRFSGSRKLR